MRQLNSGKTILKNNRAQNEDVAAKGKHKNTRKRCECEAAPTRGTQKHDAESVYCGGIVFRDLTYPSMPAWTLWIQVKRNKILRTHKKMMMVRAVVLLTKAAPPREYAADLPAPHNDDEEANHVNPDASKKQSNT